MQIALTGDVMLGRMVNEYRIKDKQFPPEKLWGDVLPLLHAADLRLINLECVISIRGQKWHPLTKVFHFRAHPRAIDFLKAAAIDGVTLANNHALDYGTEALEECLDLLDQAGIRQAGAGRDLTEAMAPAFLETPEGTIAVIALTDDMRAWAAQHNRVGLNYVAHSAQGMVEPDRSRMQTLIATARQQATLVIVSAHVGPNWGKPSRSMRVLAHELLDLGADMYWGHSNHTPQGIEVYDGKPILYAAGDFIDDYMIDLDERNDLSFLFIVEIDQGRIHHIRLHPVAIDDMQVRRAHGEEVHFLQERMRTLSAELGTTVDIHDDLCELALG